LEDFRCFLTQFPDVKAQGAPLRDTAPAPPTQRCSSSRRRPTLAVRTMPSSIRQRKLHHHSMFVRLISHQPAVLFCQNKPATSNQPAILFSQNKSAPTISHQPNEQAVPKH
jgi:hypothetical protein